MFEMLAGIHQDAVGTKAGFRLRYQPIVDTQTGTLVGAEALLRWIHPEQGEISPNKFIGFLESDPCYYDLGLYVLKNAMEFTRRMRQTIPDFRINVNITALQLQHDDFIPTIQEIASTVGIPCQAVILELTERCKEMDADFLALQIRKLRGAGFAVAFDDMGTGYSTIALLMTIPVDEIKLDREFVMGLEESTKYQIFTRALMQGAKENHYVICFEGIESVEMLDHVRLYGESYFQGYLFSWPLRPEQFWEKHNQKLVNN